MLIYKIKCNRCNNYK